METQIIIITIMEIMEIITTTIMEIMEITTTTTIKEAPQISKAVLIIRILIVIRTRMEIGTALLI